MKIKLMYALTRTKAWLYFGKYDDTEMREKIKIGLSSVKIKLQMKKNLLIPLHDI